MIRVPRSTSLSLTAMRSTIRFPYTFPSLIMVAVEIIFNINFVAVPAFIRVEPVTTSGPVTAFIITSTSVILNGLGFVTR